MKVRVLSPRFAGGKVGDVVDIDPSVLSVRALVKSRIVELVPDKPKKPTKKAAAKKTAEKVTD